jgi:hypothetical protein
MRFTELLRGTVLLLAGSATMLGAVTVIAASAEDDTTTLIVAAGWWLVAILIGLSLGRANRARAGLSEALAAAKTTPLLPAMTPGRVAFGRLWPLVAFAFIAAGLGFFFPPVPAIGTGYALLVALVWRNREAAVTGVEDRDGVRFYVESGSAFESVRLIRTPGLGRDRAPAGHPPAPPPAE